MKFMNGDLLMKVINEINNHSFDKINFIMYTNTDHQIVRKNVKGVKHLLKKPCTKVDIENLFRTIEK